jgi:fumarate hydratase class II
MSTQSNRIAHDSMGPMEIPANALWGAQTQRAVENFPISGIPFPRGFVRALGLVKKAAALTNVQLNLLDSPRSAAIEQAAQEVIEGTLDSHFPLDIFQTGSGTSTNMNANEVIATRATQLLARQDSPLSVHPNDHVNCGQSSNDVIPTCIHIAAVEALSSQLLPALKALSDSLERKAREFDDVLKIGRTHLQDATPVRLGQEFGGYARMVANARQRIEQTMGGLEELPLGGTAVGTGINTHPQFAARTIETLNRITGQNFVEAPDHFEAQGARDAAVHCSGALKSCAVSLIKIANDIRWLGSGPRCGIGELILPAVQPGSSIMPGKVNPVMAEALLQVGAQVIGNDAAITLGGLSGNFELNVMMPVIARNLLESITLLANAVSQFDSRCVQGLEADRERCSALIEGSLALITSFAPVVGYDTAAKIAKQAWEEGKTIRQIVQELQLLPAEQLKGLLDAASMT